MSNIFFAKQINNLLPKERFYAYLEGSILSLNYNGLWFYSESKTKLSPKIYAGASYHLGKHHTFGALLYGDFFKGTFKPAFGLSYNLELGHIWTVGINASYRNSSFNNIGIFVEPIATIIININGIAAILVIRPNRISIPHITSNEATK